MSKPCKRCQADPRPANFAMNRECAFTSGVFSADNWRCGTIDALESTIEDNSSFYNDDTTLSVIQIKILEEPENDVPSGSFLVLTRYKSRGSVSSLIWLGDFEPRPVTLKVTEQVLSGH